jgi:putative FmdB family regulatory protein
MPTYEYRCGACGHEFEEYQSITAESLKKCPACKKRTLERLIGTGGGIIFRGGGFYQTDYRSESYKKAAAADSSSNSSSSDKSTDSGTKSADKAKEPKPAAKSSSAKPAPAAAGK